MEQPNDPRGCLLSVIVGATCGAVSAFAISYFAFQGNWIRITAIAVVMGMLGGVQQMTVIEAMVFMVISTLLVVPITLMKGVNPWFVEVFVQLLCGSMIGLSVGALGGALTTTE